VSLRKLPKRQPQSHKADFGRLLLIGGSRGMAGSISLSGMAALRSGAGLVTIATADACLDTVAQFHPCYMTVPLQNDAQGRIDVTVERIVELAERVDCLAIGPGLGQSDSLRDLVWKLYQTIAKPLIIDADGLNALAVCKWDSVEPAGPRVLTPHPGEFRRLIRDDAADAKEFQERAPLLAKTSNAVIVLKGHRTLVANGEKTFVNETGNPGMATGGSGDVLTGIIAALIGQKLPVYEAACTGVHIHGIAGDLAAEHYTDICMTALDIVHALPGAFSKYQAQSRRLGIPTHH
jgi:NAD(P)H-hydrate epimerase